MGKVAIVGVEGSGKTVLMAGLCECFKQVPGSDEPYLMPENQAAFKFMETVPYMLRVKRQWPSATSIDNLRAMRWTYRSGDEVLETVEMLDYPGELYRLAFGDAEEVRKEDLEYKRDEVKKFLDHLIDADTLLVLLNLSDVINLGENHKNLETVWITRGILSYANRLPNIKHTVLVFTQADRYAAELQVAGGPEGLYANRLPMLKTLFPKQEVMAVSAVDHVDRNGLPSSDYRSDSCLELMRIIMRDADDKAQNELAECQKLYQSLKNPSSEVKSLFGLGDQYQQSIEKFRATTKLFRGYYSEKLTAHTIMSMRFNELIQEMRSLCGGNLCEDNLCRISTDKTVWVNLAKQFPEFNFVGRLHDYYETIEIERVEATRKQKGCLKVLCVSGIILVLGWFVTRFITIESNNAVFRKAESLAAQKQYQEAIDHVRYNVYESDFLKIARPEPPPSWAIGKQRMEQMRCMLETAKKEMASQDWDKTISTADAILQIESSHQEANSIKTDAINRRNAAQNLARKIGSLLEKARYYSSSNLTFSEKSDQWKKLSECCANILELDWKNAEALELKKTAERMLTEIAAQQEADQIKGKLIYDALFRCEKLVMQDIWEGVLTNANMVLNIDSNNEKAKAFQTMAKNKIDPSILVKATVDGHDVVAKLFFGSDMFKTPVWLKVREGLFYNCYCIYSAVIPDANYGGAYTFSVDWKGVKSISIPLSKMQIPTVNKDWVSPSSKMEFVWIPVMKIWAGKFEVTNGEYRMKEKEHRSMDFKGQIMNGERQPAVNVNFYDAKEYATWLTDRDKVQLGGLRYRVPSEEEWQNLAQCGDEREYPWGNSILPKWGNYADFTLANTLQMNRIEGYNDGFAVTCPVELSGLNEWGLYGVGGNVWECCVANKEGMPLGVWRGGSWGESSFDFISCSYRYNDGGVKRDSYSGFRLVLSR